MKTSILLLLSILAAVAADVRLTWTPRPAAEGVDYYVVYQDSFGGLVPIAATVTNSCTLTNLANGTHRFFVGAHNRFGAGIPAGPLTVSLFDYPFGSPGIPSGLTAVTIYRP